MNIEYNDEGNDFPSNNDESQNEYNDIKRNSSTIDEYSEEIDATIKPIMGNSRKIIDVGESTSLGFLIKSELESELLNCYLGYAMSVIVSRALPDILDGLKPVQRRVLYSMWINGQRYTDRTKKCVKIVGDVMGSFHPHGDSPTYLCLVRLVQDFIMSTPMIIGQGSFGSVDGDPAASFRYTEAKLSKIAAYLLKDLDHDVVEMVLNYDGSTFEPTTLPVMFPNLLVNGASGIAVGMATNIAPHNLGEVIEATKMFLKNPEISLDELLTVMPAPDFPTGGEILFGPGIKSMYTTGRGGFTVRGRSSVSERKVIFHDIPYQTNKSHIVMQIASLIERQELLGAIEVVDESDRKGIKIVVYLRKDAYPDLIIKTIYSGTDLQGNFNGLVLCLQRGIPKIVSLIDILKSFADFRHQTIIAKYSNKLQNSREKIQTLTAMIVAKDNVEEVINITKNANGTSDAIETLMSKTWRSESIIQFVQKEFDYDIDPKNYQLSLKQSESIVDMKLKQLTKIETTDLLKKMSDIITEINYFSKVVSSHEERTNIIFEELSEIQKLSCNRRSKIIYDHIPLSANDLIPNDAFIVLIDLENHIKKMPLSDYRVQHRGGVGKSGMDQIPSNIIVANALDNLLFFTNMGNVFFMQCYTVPTFGPQAKGRALINFMPLEKNEKVTNIISVDKTKNSHIVFITSHGMVKKNNINLFTKIRSNGKTAMQLDENDQIIRALCVNENDKVAITTSHGKTIIFATNRLREVQSCNSQGVRGVKLSGSDKVVDACSVSDTSFIVAVSEQGQCKVTPVAEYRETNRGSKGVIGMKLSPGDMVISGFSVNNLEGEILTITREGLLVRSKTSEIRNTGRNTKGVRLIRLQGKDKIIFSLSNFHLFEKVIL
jgi:DNA gyrase subunit A